MKEMTMLIVKHFPSELCYDDRKELLKLFGAKYVRCMPDEGRMKYTAFASFENHYDAKQALSRLHQLDILDRKLVVEFARSERPNEFSEVSESVSTKPSQRNEQSSKASEKENLKIEMEKFTKNLHGVCSSLGLDYIPSPFLKYKYPSPTPSIIANISHALVAVPKFYNQVLHLMNKMNLPAPFGPLTPAPPFAPEQSSAFQSGKTQFPSSTEQELYKVEEMETSTEESELESDNENPEHGKPGLVLPLKRQKTKVKKQYKKNKFQRSLPPVAMVTSGPRTEPSEVFDSQLPLDSQKKIQFNLKPGLQSNVVQEPIAEPSTSEQETGGFGILVASKTDGDLDNNREEAEDEDLQTSGFISLHELRKKRISYREMKTMSIYRNYDPGEPTVRLYIKNLARQVEEKDLRYVFGRFANFNSEIDKAMFDVRLMKEGRMKGQAFVTLANEKQAVEAVRETNGFILHTKPLVVQFARSAKPKDAPNKDQRKKQS